MTSTTSLASRTVGLPQLNSTPAPGAPPEAAAGAGRASGPSIARTGTSPVLAARTAGAGKPTTSKAKAGTTRKTGAKKPAGKGATGKAGYAQGTLPAEYAFLRDPKLSLEEKLSRFIGVVMAKAENDLLAQMERMAGGSAAQGGSASSTSSTTGSGGTSSAGASGAGGAAAPKKKKGFSIWSAVKVLMPEVGMASKVLGDAATKKLVQQLSGPVLAAAATALGMPQLAPVAMLAGKALGAVATDDARGAGAAVTALGGMAAGALTSSVGGSGGILGTVTNAAKTGTSGTSGWGATGGATGTTGSSGTAGGTGGTGAGAKPTTSGTSRSEMADQLELQRLMERQKETFSILSNILRMNHEARMTSIQNIR